MAPGREIQMCRWHVIEYHRPSIPCRIRWTRRFYLLSCDYFRPAAVALKHWITRQIPFFFYQTQVFGSAELNTIECILGAIIADGNRR
jgi:hypothetical protein